jgi:hypothetical protein
LALDDRTHLFQAPFEGLANAGRQLVLDGDAAERILTESKD